MGEVVEVMEVRKNQREEKILIEKEIVGSEEKGNMNAVLRPGRPPSKKPNRITPGSHILSN
jgi:hypothetical protein